VRAHNIIRLEGITEDPIDLPSVSCRHSHGGEQIFEHMKLNDLLLCLDCDEVFERTERNCPSCSSRQSFPIAPWLNRTKLETIFFLRTSKGRTELKDVARYSTRKTSA